MFQRAALFRCLDVERPNERHVGVSLLPDADSFEPEEPTQKAAAMDKWEGEDEEEDVKVISFIDY